MTTKTIEQTVSLVIPELTTTNQRSSKKSQRTNADSKAKREEFAKAVGFQTYGDPELEKLLNACCKFWGSLWRQESPKWLVMIGDTGVGKTHMAKNLARLAYKLTRLHAQGDITLGPRTGGRSYESHVYSWPKITRGFYNGDYDIVEDIRDEWFVVIDDIGSTRAKMDDLVIDQLFQILDGRHDKWTVITSNKSLRDLAALDLRIQDRLLRRQSQVVICQTKSYSLR